MSILTTSTEPLKKGAADTLSGPRGTLDLSGHNPHTAKRMIADALESASGASHLLPEAREKTNPKPSPAQIKAGNYKKGRVRVHGMEVAIENPAGSTRRGIGPGGKPWSVEMKYDYGYLTEAVGKDGDKVDVFLGPVLGSEMAFVIDQVQGGAFDEHKVVLGCMTEAQARLVYLANYPPGWQGIGGITPMTLPHFKQWLRHQAKHLPVADISRKSPIMETLDPQTFSVAVTFNASELQKGIVTTREGWKKERRDAQGRWTHMGSSASGSDQARGIGYNLPGSPDMPMSYPTFRPYMEPMRTHTHIPGPTPQDALAEGYAGHIGAKTVPGELRHQPLTPDGAGGTEKKVILDPRTGNKGLSPSPFQWHHYGEDKRLADLFMVKFPGAGEKNFVEAWDDLSPHSKDRVIDTFRAAGVDFSNGGKIDFSGQHKMLEDDEWPLLVAERGGNWMSAAEEMWLGGTVLRHQESAFGKVLAHAGLHVRFNPPTAEYPVGIPRKDTAK